MHRLLHQLQRLALSHLSQPIDSFLLLFTVRSLPEELFTFHWFIVRYHTITFFQYGSKQPKPASVAFCHYRTGQLRSVFRRWFPFQEVTGHPFVCPLSTDSCLLLAACRCWLNPLVPASELFIVPRPFLLFFRGLSRAEPRRDGTWPAFVVCDRDCFSIFWYNRFHTAKDPPAKFRLSGTGKNVEGATLGNLLLAEFFALLPLCSESSLFNSAVLNDHWWCLGVCCFACNVCSRSLMMY